MDDNFFKIMFIAQVWEESIIINPRGQRRRRRETNRKTLSIILHWLLMVIQSLKKFLFHRK